MAVSKRILGRVPVSRGDYKAGDVLYKDNLVSVNGVTYQVVAEQTTAEPSEGHPDFKIFAGAGGERLNAIESLGEANTARIEEIGEAVEANAARIEELRAAVGEGEGEEGLSGRMSAAEAAISKQKTESAAASAAIKALQDTVGSAEGAAEGLSGRVEKIESQLSDGVGSVRGITLNGEMVEADSDKMIHLRIEQQGADETLDNNSTNPIQNKAVASEIAQLKSKTPAEMEVEEGEGSLTLKLLNQQGQSIAEAELPMLGGGGGDDQGSSIRLVVSAAVDKSVVRGGEAVELTWSYDSVYSSGDDAGTSAGLSATVSVEVRRGGAAVSRTATANVSKGTYKTQIGDLLGSGSNDIYVIAEATDPESGKVKKKQAWAQVYVSSLALKSTYSLTDAVKDGGAKGSVTIPYTITGTGSKTIQCYVDGVLVQSQSQNMSGSRAGEFSVTLGGGYSAGRHSVQLVAQAVVEGKELTSNSVYIDVLKSGGGGKFAGVKFERSDGRIFGGNERPSLQTGQYEQTELNYAVYDPESEQAEVEIKLDGKTYAQHKAERKQQKLSLRFTSQGEHTVSISAGGSSSGSGSRTLGVEVAASSLNLSVATQGLSHELNAEGRSNNESDPGQWDNAIEGGAKVITTFEGVDWSTSGWTGESLKLQNGAKAIVGIKPFATDSAQSGQTLELIVKVDNVAEPDHPLISCINGGKGFTMTSREISYLTGQSVDYTNEEGAAANRSVGLTTKYSHGGWMRVSLVISARSDENLMELYVDGDRVGADLYGATYNFRQSTPQAITIDSNGADIEVRRIRMYGRGLSDDEVLDNAIVEQDTSARMLEMWQSNNVLGESSELSMQKLRAQDKSVMQIVRSGYLDDIYETNNKKKDFSGDVHFYPGSAARAAGAKEMHLHGVYIRIQGTSSTKYPAKNLRIYLQRGEDGFRVEIGGEEKTGADRKYSLRSTTPGQGVLCAKKDYSDSTMSTNTGGAKLFHNTMASLGLLTPPQKRQKAQGGAISARTAIDGLPCDIFASETMEGEPRYYGQYNLNNEKSESGGVFGMEDMDGGEPWACPLALESLNNMEGACLFAPEANAAGMSAWLAAHFDGGMEVNYSRSGDDCKWAGLSQGERGALERLYSWIAACKPAGADSKSIDTWVSSKFKKEASQYFDVDFLLTYYLMINYMMGVDQLSKNILWRTWDGEIWYPTYYDGDTQWGKRNDSFLVYDYNITRDSWDAQAGKYAFEGHDSWLWNMVLANFPDELAGCCDKLREKMKNSDISGMLLGEQAGNWAERTYNKSGRIAYIDPAVKETYGRKWPFIYAGQGRNTPHREYMIKNRCAVMDARWCCGDYREDNIDLYLSQGSDGVSSLVVTGTEAYAFGYGTNNKAFISTTGIVEADEEAPLSITGQYTINDPVRIYGASRMKTLDCRGMSGSMKNGLILDKCAALRELDLSVPGDGESKASTEWFFKIDGCRQLRRLNLNGQSQASTGANDSDTIDLRGQNRLEYLDARGTSAAHVLFASGGKLREAYLPETLESLLLDHLPELTQSGLTVPAVAAIRDFGIEGCEQLKDSRALTMRWLNGKNTPDGQCTVRLTDIDWGDCPVSDALRLARLVNAIKAAGMDADMRRVTGTIRLTATPTPAEANELIDAFGSESFSGTGLVKIVCSGGDFIIAAPASVTEGASAEEALEVRIVALQPMDAVSITAKPSGTGINTAVDPDRMTVKIWSQEQGGERSVTITVKGTPADGMERTVSAEVEIVPYVYPAGFTVEGSDRLLPGQSYVFELVAEETEGVNGSWQTAWSVSGEGSEAVTLSQMSRDSVRVSVAADAEIGEAVVKATVSRKAGSEAPLGEPIRTAYLMTGQMLMTKYSNGPLLALCKERNYCDRDDYMTFDEASAVKAISNIENNQELTSLDELWWFTGVTSIPKIYNCTNVTSARLPQKSQGKALDSCLKLMTNLRYVELPEGMTGSESRFLEGAKSLEVIVCHAAAAPDISTDYGFGSVKSHGMIYAPAGATGYDTQAAWKRLIIYGYWQIRYTL